VATVIRTLKTNLSRAFCAEFGMAPPLWARGYLARSTGRVRVEAVRRYLDQQVEHHGYARRVLPPVFRWRAPVPITLRAAHACFELNYHVVLATRHRAGVFGSQSGRDLATYWLSVANKYGFAIDRISIVPDHIHLLGPHGADDEYRNVYAVADEQRAVFYEQTFPIGTDAEGDRSALASVGLRWDVRASGDGFGKIISESGEPLGSLPLR